MVILDYTDQHDIVNYIKARWEDEVKARHYLDRLKTWVSREQLLNIDECISECVKEAIFERHDIWLPKLLTKISIKNNWLFQKPGDITFCDIDGHGNIFYEEFMIFLC